MSKIRCLALFVFYLLIILLFDFGIVVLNICPNSEVQSFRFVVHFTEPKSAWKDEIVVSNRLWLWRQHLINNNNNINRRPLRRRSLFLQSSTSSSTSLEPNITILYESDRIIAICKPEGISHHDDTIQGSGMLSLIRRKQLCGDIQYQGRIYGIHRLDRVTSGILLFAKDSTTAQIISNQFRNGNIIKYYIGLSCKKPSKKKQGIVQGNMIPSRNKSWILTRDANNKSESNNFAKTRFYTSGISNLDDHLLIPNNIIDSKNSTTTTTVSLATTIINPPPKTLLLFRPYTGKTHQITINTRKHSKPSETLSTYYDLTEFYS